MKFRADQEKLQEEHRTQLLQEGKGARTPKQAESKQQSVPQLAIPNEEPPKFQTQKERNIWHAK